MVVTFSRRSNPRGYRRYEVENRTELDKLLDYFQAMEALLSIEGSYQIALYAAVLLGGAGGNRAVTAADTFEFIKDMHTIRNAVIHGRHADVISGKVKTKAKTTLHESINRLGYCARELGILRFLNGDLRPIAHRLALGEGLTLKTQWRRDVH